MNRTSRLPRAIVAAACTAVVAVTTIGCSSDSQKTLADTVKIAISEQITSMNPYTNVGATVAKFAYDSLVNVTTEGEVVSGIAGTWDATSESATFTLQENVECSDGSMLTASDVAAALSYASDPENQLESPRVILPSVPFSAEGDDTARTVTVTMSQPYSFILRTVGLLPIVCAAGLADPESLATTSAGTGPYVFNSSSSSGPYEFTIREGYSWGPDGASTSADGMPAKVEISVIPDESTMANLLVAGEVNIGTVSGSDRARLAAAKLLDVPVPVASGLTFFNQAPGRALENAELRKGLVEALDRQALANVVEGGQGTPGTGLRAVNAVCHADLADEHLPSGDPVATLNKGGWNMVDGKLEKDGKPLSLQIIHLSSFAQFGSAAELMADNWKGLGVTVDIRSQDTNGFINSLYETGDWDVMVGSNAMSLPSSLVPLFSGATPPDGINFSHVNNADYTALVSQALTKEGETSCSDWQSAAAALMKAASVLPVADGSAHYWGHDTEFALTDSGANAPTIDPTSIRLLG